MPALSRGQENTTSILNWFITVNSVPTDAYEVSYRIFDIASGLPGTQIFPTAAGTYEDVTNAPGKFGVGSYYAYDNTEAEGWTPELTATVGTHRIEWRWKITAASPYQAWYEDFEILVQSAGSSTDTYISISDVRDEGLLEADYSDAKVLSYIETWQSFLERACRQWFLPRSMTFLIDGTDSDALHFGVPIIDISYVKINGSTDELDTSLYKVYNRRDDFKDRWNPRIKLVNSVYRTDIYTSPDTGRRLIFRKGRQNQEVSGTFGFVEGTNKTTPHLIKRALLKLVIEKLTAPLYVAPGSTGGGGSSSILGNILEEVTDGHRIKYSQAGGGTKPGAIGLRGITEDPEILQIIKLYRAPLGIATPANPSFR